MLLMLLNKQYMKSSHVGKEELKASEVGGVEEFGI